MGCSVATGTAYHGKATKQGKVLYIATEGAFGVGRKRLPAWMGLHQIRWSCATTSCFWPVKFSSAGDMEDMVAVIMEVLGESPALIIVDVLAGTMDGSESDDEAAKEWVNAATRLVMKLETALLVSRTRPIPTKAGCVDTAIFGAASTVVCRPRATRKP